MPNEPGLIPKFSTILLFGIICLCKKIKAGEGSVICHFAHGGDTFHLGTTSLLERSSSCWEAYTQTCPKWDKICTTACWCRSMTPCQVSWFSGEFWISRNLKTKFLNFPGRATTPRCLNFIPISCMGPRNSPKDTHVMFQPILVH